MSGDILQYERPAITVDCVLFRTLPPTHEQSARFQVRLIRRLSEPEGNKLSIIGAFVPIDQRLEDVLQACLIKKAGSHNTTATQFSVFDTPGRDERWRVISIAYIGMDDDDCDNTDFDAQWYTIDAMNRMLTAQDGKQYRFEELAFDHGEILSCAIESLQEHIRLRDPFVLSRLLPRKFTISELKEIIENILGVSINNVKRSFKNVIEPLDEIQLDDNGNKPKHRPSVLYAVKPDDDKELK